MMRRHTRNDCTQICSAIAALWIIMCAHTAWAATLTIEDAHHATLHYVESGGVIASASHSVVGYVQSSGVVEDASHRTLGYIDHTDILDAHRARVGSYSRQGDGFLFLDAHQSIVAYLHANGVVENSHHQTVAYIHGALAGNDARIAGYLFFIQ